MLALLSFAQDRRWRAQLVAYSRPKGYVLDVATGTGLLAADLAKAVPGRGLVVGVDLTLSMLKTARRRLSEKKLDQSVDWVLARAEELPFRDDSFHSSTISLALRNVSDAGQTFREMSRTTQSGGLVVSLDFARPTNPVFKIFYYDYLLGLFPLFGRMVSKAWADTLLYLGRSIMRARTGDQIAELMGKVGLKDSYAKPMTMGIVYAVYGKKR